MITDPDRFKHDRSSYERPTASFRCGREARWRKPCFRGPNPDGSCGGTVECTPVKSQSGRFECRRPRSAGGPCRPGPSSDGSCSQKHPPCVPRLTLPAWRARLAFLAFSLAVSSLASLLVTARASGPASLSPIDPGPLSAKHATFTQEKGCASCHAVHTRNAAGWLSGLFVKSHLSAQCESCHQFGGPGQQAHNAAFEGRAGPAETTCVMCHTEHEGADAKITAVSDAQCSTCHLKKFKSFSQGHPPFPETFPHENRTAIQFDHAAHLNKYFQDPKVRDKAPASCATCHATQETAERRIKSGSFEQTCASCHAAGISQRELALFRLPELTARRLDPALLQDACRDVGRGDEPSTLPEGGSFVSISTEPPTAVSAYLLNVDASAPDVYGKPIEKLIHAMAQEGPGSLARLLDERAGTPVSGTLLAGLGPEVLRQAACAWAANREYEPPSATEFSGWHADLLELRYSPAGHADPVVKGWIEFAIRVSGDVPEGGDGKRAQDMREQLLSKTSGPGRCTTCHAVTRTAQEGGGERFKVEWKDEESGERPYTKFSHRPHLEVLGEGQACATCHVINLDAPRDGSNFKPIGKETCLRCHALGEKGKKSGVRQDCLLCHAYHLNPTLASPGPKK